MTVDSLAMLDIWLALHGDPRVFDRWIADPQRHPADAWSQLLAAVAGDRDLLERDTNPPAGELLDLVPGHVDLDAISAWCEKVLGRARQGDPDAAMLCAYRNDLATHSIRSTILMLLRRARPSPSAAPRAPGIPEDTLAVYLGNTPPDGWHEIDNLDPDEARAVAILAIQRARTLGDGVARAIGALSWDHNVGEPGDECPGCATLGILHALLPDVPTTP